MISMRKSIAKEFSHMALTRSIFPLITYLLAMVKATLTGQYAKCIGWDECALFSTGLGSFNHMY